MLRSIDVKRPKHRCSFANLWFQLFMYSNNITCERLIYKYLVYPIYIIGLYLMILSIDNYNNRLDIIILSVVFICLGGIGSTFDIINDNDWSPTKELCRYVNVVKRGKETSLTDNNGTVSDSEVKESSDVV